MGRKKRQSNIGSKNRGRTMFISKIAIVMILITFQIIMMAFIYGFLHKSIIYWKTGTTILSWFIVIYMINKKDNPAYKLAWIVLLMAVPLVGGLLYIILAGNRTRRIFVDKAKKTNYDSIAFLPDNEEILEEIQELSKSACVQSRYISKVAGYPVYKNTEVEYFKLGEENYEALKRELNEAKHFIFMEYFIIRQGEMWENILEILTRKVKEGVEVRLMYDDFGCAMSMPGRFNKEMSELGIKVTPFNRVVPILSLRQNNRDHRKITVIDGHTGFTGGINIADEYINREDRFGHWKDTGIMLRGEAVWNLTVMFLQNWQLATGEPWDYRLYVPNKYKEVVQISNGYVQPYGDTPVDDEIVGENIYLNMINKAKHYVYIMTPYLIVDNEMITSLTLAAKNGIDVRIITPGIPDKKTVFLVTQSYYNELAEAGVKIYQYTPGFVHAKTVIVDDSIATVGTVNFDFRSLYLHFECGVWMYNVDTIYEIKEDYMNTLSECEEITLGGLSKTSGIKRLGQSLLRLFAPLM